MKIRFERPHPVSTACYLFGGGLLLLAWIGFSYQWWPSLFAQQLFIGGAIIVCIGSIINLVVVLSRIWRHTDERST